MNQILFNKKFCYNCQTNFVSLISEEIQNQLQQTDANEEKRPSWAESVLVYDSEGIESHGEWPDGEYRQAHSSRPLSFRFVHNQ